MKIKMTKPRAPKPVVPQELEVLDGNTGKVDTVLAVPPPKTKPSASVILTFTFSAETTKYVEVLIGGEKSWFQKTSIDSYSVAGDMVTIEMPRALAVRRKLLDPDGTQKEV